MEKEAKKRKQKKILKKKKWKEIDIQHIYDKPVMGNLRRVLKILN